MKEIRFPFSSSTRICYSFYLQHSWKVSILVLMTFLPASLSSRLYIQRFYPGIYQKLSVKCKNSYRYISGKQIMGKNCRSIDGSNLHIFAMYMWEELTSTLITAVAPHADTPICLTCSTQASYSLQIITFSMDLSSHSSVTNSRPHREGGLFRN